MSQKHFLLKGTFILTVVGILTRVMGFFYRIFLSRSFPAEEIGLYQLIFLFLLQTALLLMLQLQQESRRLWRAWLPPLLQKSSLQKLILT